MTIEEQYAKRLAWAADIAERIRLYNAVRREWGDKINGICLLYLCYCYGLRGGPLSIER